MPDKRCSNGHIIDATWDICPYCPAEKQTGDIPVVQPRPASRPDESRVPPPPVVLRRPVEHPATEPPDAPQRTIAVSKPNASALEPNRFVVGWLVGLSSSIRGESFPIRSGRNVLGRDRKSDIVVPDDQASAHHADLVFRPEERRFILMDHNSTNGTFVNEAEIEPRRDLTRNDIVRIGSHRFLFFPLCGDGFNWDEDLAQ